MNCVCVMKKIVRFFFFLHVMIKLFFKKNQKLKDILNFNIFSHVMNWTRLEGLNMMTEYHMRRKKCYADKIVKDSCTKNMVIKNKT